MATTQTSPIEKPATDEAASSVGVSPAPSEPAPMMLESGASHSAREFHELYAAYPDDTRFELIDGEVRMASPLHMPHAEGSEFTSFYFRFYKGLTPGVRGGEGLSVRLDELDELQPDNCLFVPKELGGKAFLEKDNAGNETFLKGSPELVFEAANSSRSIDFGRKMHVYARAGVREYLVLDVGHHQLHWFSLPTKTRFTAGDDGVIRSEVMPGLWIRPEHFLQQDVSLAIELLQEAAASDEHKAFAKELADKRDAQAK